VGPGVGSEPDELREVQAFLRLKEVPGLGDRGVRRLVESYGSGAAALAALRRQDGLRGVPRARKAPPEPRTPIKAWDPGKYIVLPMTSSRYPGPLTDLTDPPPLLFLRGREELLHRPAVAVVGARRATEVGRRTAEALGRVLARAGVTVVSGLALGIDGAAHRGALEAGGDTVAVLGSGLDLVYPGSHRALSRRIGREGLLVSEFLPPEASLPHHFPKRNRIIAALSSAVVVVEAGKKSGALITVDHALDLGRDVLAVPGSVESPLSTGTNGLLREGARALPHPEAIMQELEELFPGLLERGGAPAADSTPTAPLPRELRPLLTALSTEPRGVDVLAQEAALPSGEALAGLLALELGGWAVQCPGLRFQRQGGGR